MGPEYNLCGLSRLYMHMNQFQYIVRVGSEYEAKDKNTCISLIPRPP